MGVEVAVGASIVGALANAGGSLVQANKQKSLAQQAKKSAEQAVASARAELEKNYMEAVTLPTKAYEMQREGINQQSANLLASGVEGDQRGAGAVASQVMAARTQAEQELGAQIQKDEIERQKLISAEDARLAGARAGISLQEAEGAAMAQRDAEIARAQAQQNAAGAVAQGAASIAQIYGSGAQPGGKGTDNTGGNKASNYMGPMSRNAPAYSGKNNNDPLGFLNNMYNSWGLGR